MRMAESTDRVLAVIVTTVCLRAQVRWLLQFSAMDSGTFHDARPLTHVCVRHTGWWGSIELVQAGSSCQMLGAGYHARHI